MVATDLIIWWYSRGYGFFVSKIFDKLHNTADFFSIVDLLKTLFAPFRQISAEGTSSLALDVRIRAAFDRLFSRFMGAIIRILLIIIGLIALAIQFALSLAFIIAWPLLPFTPLACIFLAINGVLPL